MNERVKGLMSPEEVSKYVGMSVQWVYRYAQEGRLPAIKFGGNWKFRKEDVDKWLDKTLSPVEDNGMDDNTQLTEDQFNRLILKKIEDSITEEVSRPLNENGIKESQLKKVIEQIYGQEGSQFFDKATKNLRRSKLISLFKEKKSNWIKKEN